MIIGLILIAAAHGTVQGAQQNGFDAIKANHIGTIVTNGPIAGWTDSSWTQLKAGISLAVFITPIFLGLMIISFLIGLVIVNHRK